VFTACGIMHRQCCLLVTRMRWNWVPPHPGNQQAPSSVLYTTSCKHSLVLLKMGKIMAGNMLSWLKLLIKLVLLHPVGCLYYCISDARSHKHQRPIKSWNKSRCHMRITKMCNLKYNVKVFSFFYKHQLIINKIKK